MTDKIREAFSKEVWSDTVLEGCGPTALDIYTAGYQARDRELRAELEAAKKDAERLDYVLRKQLIVVQDCDDEYFTYNSSSGKMGPVANSAIFAIDQAIKEKP